MIEGQRFSLIYLERKEPVRDSPRFRNRLSAYYWEYLYDNHNKAIVKIIQKETGAEIPFNVNYYSVSDFFKENEFRDVLDSITLIYRVVIASGCTGSKQRAEHWKQFVERAMKEENLGYRLDASCGVHYLVDEEFERNRFSTLSVLDDPKYNGVRAAYEDAYRYMDNYPIDTKAAVRSIFESIEILVKQMVETKNLNKWVVENTLKEKCIKIYNSDTTATKVVTEMFSGFAHWVDGLHNYRHGQAEEDPVSPGEVIAIYALSSGSAFLRWLIGINNQLNKSNKTVQ